MICSFGSVLSFLRLHFHAFREKIAFWPLSLKMFSLGLLREKTFSHIFLSVGVAIHSLGTKKPFKPTLLVRPLLLTHKSEWLVFLSAYFRYVLINKSSESHPFQAKKTALHLPNF